MRKILTLMLSVSMSVSMLWSCGESSRGYHIDGIDDNGDCGCEGYCTDGCDGDCGAPEGRTAPHAMLLYFVGTGLDYYFGNNVAAAMSAVDKGIPGDNRMAYFRRVSGGEWAITEIYYDCKSRKAALRELRRYPAADLRRMDLFLRDMTELVPAESYGVVFGGHGSAWIPRDIGTSWSTTYAAMQPHEYVMPFGEAPSEGAAPTRYFGETSVNFDIGEIADNMLATGAKFDYVLFDDCFMSNIETLYTMRHAADYIIASPCEIMGAGFPYALVTPCLAGGEYDFEGACRAFYDYYENDSYPSGCVALTVCSELEALAEAYRNLLSGPTTAVESAELQYYEGLSRHLFYDFGQYAAKLSADPALLDEFERQFDRAFPPSCRLHTESFYSNYGGGRFHRIDSYSGVTISEPAGRNEELNRQTEWYRATHGEQ